MKILSCFGATKAASTYVDAAHERDNISTNTLTLVVRSREPYMRWAIFITFMCLCKDLKILYPLFLQ